MRKGNPNSGRVNQSQGGSWKVLGSWCGRKWGVRGIRWKAFCRATNFTASCADKDYIISEPFLIASSGTCTSTPKISQFLNFRVFIKRISARLPRGERKIKIERHSDAVRSGAQCITTRPSHLGRRVPGLPIRDCAGSCNNCVPRHIKIIAT